MKYCERCGYPLDDNDFCANCLKIDGAGSGELDAIVRLQNEKLREALGLALQYLPIESNDKNIQDEIDKIHLLINEAT